MIRFRLSKGVYFGTEWYNGWLDRVANVLCMSSEALQHVIYDGMETSDIIAALHGGFQLALRLEN